MPITGDHPWTVAMMNWETMLEPGWSNLRTPTIDGYRCYTMSNPVTGQHVVHRMNWSNIVARVWHDTFDPAFALTHWVTTSGTTRSFRHAASIDTPGMINLHVDTWLFDDDGDDKGQSVEPTREAEFHLGRRWNDVASVAVDGDIYLFTTNATGDDIEVLHYDTVNQRLQTVQSPDLDVAAGRFTQLHTTTVRRSTVPDPTDPNPPSTEQPLLTMYRSNVGETATVRLTLPTTPTARAVIVDESSFTTTRTSRQWDHAMPFTAVLDNGDPITYLMNHRTTDHEPGGHNVEIVSIGENGTTSRVGTDTIGVGWSHVVVETDTAVSVDMGRQVSVLNTATGDAQRWVLADDGTFDTQLDPMEPIPIADVKHVWESDGDSFRDPTVHSYWRDMSVDNVDVSGVVTGWHTIPGSWESFVALGNDQRRERARAAIAAAGYMIPAGHGLVLLFAVSTFQTNASINGHRYTANLTFWQHETGHNLGFAHSWRRNVETGAETEYGDHLDIMSASSVTALDDEEGVTIGAPAGPGCNMVYRQHAGWIFPGDLIDLTGSTVGRAAYTINTLSELPDRTRVKPPYGLVFDTSDGRRLVIEYRTDYGWDAGISDAEARILEVREAGTKDLNSVLYTDADRKPVQSIYDNRRRPAISIRRNDDGTSCTVTIDDRPANTFLFAMNAFREPIADGNRYQWSEGWDHAHFFSVADRSFLYLMKSSGYGGDGHNVHIHAFDTASEVGGRVQSATWQQGWVSSEIVTAGDRTFLLALRTNGFDRDGDNIVVHEFLPGGTLSPKVAGLRLADRAWRCVTAYGSPGTMYVIIHGHGDPERDGFNARMYRLDERDDFQFGAVWDSSNLPDEITHLKAFRRLYWVSENVGYGGWTRRTRVEEISLLAGSAIRPNRGHLYHVEIKDDQTFGKITWDDPVNADISGYRGFAVSPSNGTNTPTYEITRLYWHDWGDVATESQLVSQSFTIERLRSEYRRFIEWDGNTRTLAHGVATDGTEALLALP